MFVGDILLLFISYAHFTPFGAFSGTLTLYLHSLFTLHYFVRCKNVTGKEAMTRDCRCPDHHSN